jgi:xanthine dehydrogenase accessory factor
MNSDNKEILLRGAVLEKAGTPFVLATVVRAVSPASAKPGAKAIVGHDGVIQGWVGGGCAQPAVLKSAKQALQDGQPRLIRISPTKEGNQEAGIIDIGMSCHSGGTLEIFIEPVLPRPLLAILGSSPTAQALSGLAPRVGFAVTVACHGAERHAFPDAEEVIAGFDLGTLSADRHVFVVVATQGQRDIAALEAALATGAEDIAFVASARKLGKLRDDLGRRGHRLERVAAIHAPAGLEIGAVTPEEIALSVLAGVVRARRCGQGTATRVASESTEGVVARGCCGDAMPAATNLDANCVDPVCGMSVVKLDAAHCADFEGVAYYFCSAVCHHKFVESPGAYLDARGALA